MSVGARVAIVAALATLASSVAGAAHTTAAASSVGTASTAATPRVAGTDQQIADEVHLSLQTVKNRLSRMMKVAGAANRTELALRFAAH